MKFTAFVPAVLALSFFSAVQATSSMEKRGANDANLNAAVDIFVKAHAQVAAEACAKITASVCADVDLKLNAKAKVLGDVITADADVEKIRVSAKAQVDTEVKAYVDAEVKAIVLAPIRASVEKVIVKICPLLDRACIRKNATKIVAKVNADVNVSIKKLLVNLKVDLPVHIRARAKIIVRELCVHAGIADISAKVRVYIASNIDVHVKACIRVWVKLWAKVKIVARIRAL
ncbi:hypothetical protein BGX21_001689 [Mortierella sp. AD011]|nr:hypothetical protein BGX20_008025 [Mortierella sp. AD010]KAF9401430.1 hypothetical protein BGX21_001689 [Mortierella sp. AD011]